MLAGRWVACTLMGLGVLGLLVAFVLGAPLVSVLLIGLLLLCPLLLWIPFRFERRSLDGSDPERRGHA
jgi:hypothetical protein